MAYKFAHNANVPFSKLGVLSQRLMRLWRRLPPGAQVLPNILFSRSFLSCLMTEHEKWMEFALKEAEQAYKRKEVPIGAVILRDNRIIGKGYNQIESLRDPTAHAEIIAITAATSQLNNHRLEGCTMYVTLEPCAMCAGAIVLARIPTLVFGTSDPKAGACGTLYNIVQDERLNHRVELVKGVLEAQCRDILRDFFSKLRTNEMSKPKIN